MVVRNANGVAHEHVTRVVRGEVEFRFEDRTIIVSAGQEINLPLHEPYFVVGTVPDIEVRCFYPKAVEGAVEEIQHLRTDSPESPDSKPTQTRDWVTLNEDQATPRSSTVIRVEERDPAGDGGGVEIPFGPLGPK